MDTTICDVGARDGLQNERVVLEPRLRAELVERLSSSGIRRIETASFVNPKLVPAMAGGAEVVAAIKRAPDTVYTGLVLNERGYEQALAAGVDEIRYGFSATDEFGLRNQRQTTDQGLKLARHLIHRAHADEKRISVTLIVAFGCPFAGEVDPIHVLDLVKELMDGGPPDEISLADTIGVAVANNVADLVAAATSTGARIGGHFHNTRNTGYANAIAAFEAGASVLDASVGGIGGCPFAPNATGNIATEDLVYMLEEMGVQTGIDLDRLIDTSLWLSQQLQRSLPGLVARAGRFERHPELQQAPA